MNSVGVIFPPDLAPEQMREVALAAEDAGLAELWLWEDCFKQSGIASAAAVLAWTQQLRVGIGLLPVPLRNVALTAMELATLARLFPDRIRPGVGHGVLDWMAQVGVRAQSPMTLLAEYTAALRALLHGQSVSMTGRYVQLDEVTLDWPPAVAPPLLVGGVGPKTLELAGRLADGVILTGDTTLEQLHEAVATVRSGRAATTAPPEVVVFVTVIDRPSATGVAAHVGQYFAGGATTVALHSIGDAAPPLAEFVRFVAREVQPRLL